MVYLAARAALAIHRGKGRFGPKADAPLVCDSNNPQAFSDITSSTHITK